MVFKNCESVGWMSAGEGLDQESDDWCCQKKGYEAHLVKWRMGM